MVDERHDGRFTEPEAGSEAPVPQGYNFNRDPAWQSYVQKYETVIHQIALKYCAVDEALREDVMNEARIGLATVHPETVAGFEAYVTGRMPEEEWQSCLEKFCKQVVRNSILSYLDSYRTGNWYIGRTRHVRDRQTGKSRKVYLPTRFSSLDELVDDYGMQIDSEGGISWPEPSDDGLRTRRPEPAHE